jgi:histidine kinase/DNA gyrase B/HSP90-like ATPase
VADHRGSSGLAQITRRIAAAVRLPAVLRFLVHYSGAFLGLCAVVLLWGGIYQFLSADKEHAEQGAVGVSAELRPDRSLAVTVADTGIEIAPENIPRALAPFGQVDSASSRTNEGTGLGLPRSWP